MPARNASGYIDQAVGGIVGLGSEVLELIIVVDLSTDDTLTRARVWENSSPIVKVVALPTFSGSGLARNAGVQAAAGDYVWFVDADDYWEPGYLASLMAGLRSDSGTALPDIVIGEAVVCSEEGGVVDRITVPRVGRISGSSALEMLLRGDLSGHTWNKVFRRTLLLSNPFPSLPTHQDLACLLAAVPAAQHVVLRQGPMYHYIRHADSSLHRTARPLGKLLVVASLADELSRSDRWSSIPSELVQHFIGVGCVIEVLRDVARLPASDRRGATAVRRAAINMGRQRRIVSGTLRFEKAKCIELVFAVTCPGLYGNLYRTARSLRGRKRDMSVHRHWTENAPSALNGQAGPA